MLPAGKEDRLVELLRVFKDENTKLNLSALRDDDAIRNGNILDSLAALDLSIFAKSDLKILEVGTGGGFPLLPLAICKPESQFFGLDSTQKKLGAIERMIAALGLRNVEVIAGRAEELGHDPKYREQFDIVVARALAPLNVLLELCSPFVKKGGHVVAWKSMKIDTELKESLLARAELSCHLVDQHEYELPGDWGKRQLLIFEKTDKTDPKYPRETGIPSKKPVL